MVEEFETLLDAAEEIGTVVAARLERNGSVWIEMINSSGQELVLQLSLFEPLPEE